MNYQANDSNDEKDDVSTRILGVEPCGTRLEIRNRWKGAVRLPKILVVRGRGGTVQGAVQCGLLARRHFDDSQVAVSRLESAQLGCDRRCEGDVARFERPAPAPALVLEYPPEH